MTFKNGTQRLLGELKAGNDFIKEKVCVLETKHDELTRLVEKNHTELKRDKDKLDNHLVAHEQKDKASAYWSDKKITLFFSFVIILAGTVVAQII